ncbi:Maf family nucleotide pyrophosphatase [Robiginitalea sp.]|uniref:Maf family nucleotide pyrophosphatase n=1 Tax=Robiginitalea sp. TaxID=1902411 RepID=UPI003C755A1F
MAQFGFEKIILGSGSPRRKFLLESMGMSVEVIRSDVQEVYPQTLEHHHISDYLARQKAESLKNYVKPGTILLTADTIVWFGGKVMEKPSNTQEALDTLRALSGQQHEVITSVCFSTPGQQVIKHSTTQVKFAPLTDQMIQHYVDSGQAMDKAGAYGIQEWIGLVGVESISGSYTNVVGLPTELVYKTLRALAETAI